MRVAITHIDWSSPRYPLKPQVGLTYAQVRLVEAPHADRSYLTRIESHVIPLEQVIQQFNSRDDLIEVLLASCCVYV